MPVKIALDVPEDHSYIRMIRQIGRALLAHHLASEQDIDDLEVVVGELCANVTRHARSASGCYHVSLEHHGDHVVLIVRDEGQGFDPQTTAPVGTERQDEGGPVRHGGYGLHLVGTLTDRMVIHSSSPTGTTVRAEKFLQVRDTKPAPDCVG